MDSSGLNPPMSSVHKNFSSMTDTLTNGSISDSHTLENALDDLSLGGLESDVFECQICNQDKNRPRVMNCLHTFCSTCLIPLLKEDMIECPICEMITECDGLNELPLDHSLTHETQIRAIKNELVSCTSCKSKEKAVARCCDCPGFLCNDCVTAHQFMKCFDRHQVKNFADIIKEENLSDLDLSLPITCVCHPHQELRYFCQTCQQPICADCGLTDHAQHTQERISDIKDRELDVVKRLLEEAKRQAEKCETVSQKLNQCLSELESQRDDAKSLIIETFQSYKAMLERKQDSVLEQLEQIHKQQELTVWEKSHNIESMSEKISSGCEFAERLLDKCNITEVLMLKKMVTDRLASLIEKTPKADFSIDIEFVTDNEQFKSNIEKNFGHFAFKQEQPTRPVERTAPSPQSVPTAHVMKPLTVPQNRIMPGMLDPELPVELRELHQLGGFHQIPVTLCDAPTFNQFHTPITAPPGLDSSFNTGIKGMSMFGLERSMSRQSQSPTVSDSGIGMDCSPKPASNSPPINLLDLMKVGGPSVSLTPKGDIILNRSNSTSGNLGSLRSNVAIHSPEPDTMASPGIFNPSESPLFFQAPSTSYDGSIMPGTPLLSSASSLNAQINMNSSSKKMPPMQIRHKFGVLGQNKKEFNSPHGFCMGNDQCIIVADTNNHRIQVFNKNAEFQYSFGEPGREEGHLWFPRKVAVFKNSGKFVICDRGSERSRMQIFSKSGNFIKRIAIRYIDIVAGLAITPSGCIVAVDSVSPTIFLISESGELIKWFDCADTMREPSDIAISQDNEYYVCDFKGHCVVVFNEEGQFLRRIGQEGVTNYPNGIDISDAGDILIGDSHGNRFHVVVYQKNGNLIGEFECPYVKVSRCCGLKITTEGYVITVAKNNHHVIILNTLYIS